MLAGGEHGSPLFEQSGVIRRWAPDTLAQRHDLTVEVIELAARATLEALKGRRPIRAVGWEIAGQPLAEHEVAERHGKRRHQTKGACPATLIETKSTKLGGPDTFTNRGDRQAGESSMAQRLADRPAGDRHDGVVQVRHQLGPAGAGDIGDELRLHDRTEQADNRLDSCGRLRKGRPDLEERAGVLLDHTGLEVGGADIEDASDDATSSENIGCLTVRSDAILHGDDGGVRTPSGNLVAGVLDVLRLDRQQNDVWRPFEPYRARQMDGARFLEPFDQESPCPDRIHLSLPADQLDVDTGLMKTRSNQTP